MGARKDIKSILIVGAGPIVIGQACEFDYSGTQGAKALREEGYRVILVNSNPATIMTDRDTADKIYIEPINKEIVTQILEKERPNALLPTLGGQTALNLALELGKDGVLDRLNVELIGVSVEAIEKAENRGKFKDVIEQIEIWNDVNRRFEKLKCPKNAIVTSRQEAIQILKDKYLELPLVIRPSLTLGGTGGGIAKDIKSYLELVENGLNESPIGQIQIDQDLSGWKEYELEVVRDKNDNAIVICSIENVDPMGVHTGDSITVAPAMTLTDKEYQFMRDASIEILRKIGVETGGSNIQFAVNPTNGDMVVIEMNPRVSRSSALVSKATGFPIAKVAARLAVGYTLDEIRNDIACSIPKDINYLEFKDVIAGRLKNEKIENYIKEQKNNGLTKTQLMQKVLPASFEPSIDYVVVKMPKFNFEKFEITEPVLNTQMQSVGEVMAVGRSFGEAMQKAVESLERTTRFYKDLNLVARLKINSPSKIFDILDALKDGYKIEEVSNLSKYDRWFVEQLYRMLRKDDDTSKKTVFKKIDTCANEFETNVNYFYSTKESGYKKIGSEKLIYDNEAVALEGKKVIILGSGANRIGQGIEFDYACVQASKALNSIGLKTIMINSNPETVSTDYDTSDRLYFEPVVSEYIYDIILNELNIPIAETVFLGKKFHNLGDIYNHFNDLPDLEKTDDTKEIVKKIIEKYLSVAISFGGQTALNQRHFLEKNAIPIFGNSNVAIEICDSREKFEYFCKTNKVKRPLSVVCNDNLTLDLAAQSFNYQFIIRPTSVIGGRGMSVIGGEEDYRKYLQVEDNYLPCVVDEFLEQAKEFDVDVLKDKNNDIFIAGVLEQLEYAGVHSGDSACCLPTYSITDDEKNEIIKTVIKIVQSLDVLGAVNVQIALKDGELYIIEVNPRISRTLPFISKATKCPLVEVATKVMAGEGLRECLEGYDVIDTGNYFVFKKIKYFCIKEAVFSFEKFKNCDVLLSPEMHSTGEVMSIGRTFNEAFIKTLMGTRMDIGKKDIILISAAKINKKLVDLIILARKNNYRIIVTQSTFNLLKNEVEDLESTDNAVELIKNKKVGIFISVGRISNDDDFCVRREVLAERIPYTTNVETAKILVDALVEYNKLNDIKIVED
ncbi:MAG: ATP-grasp domain-containing protein [Rickettsiales bacterium]|jgi:carbamoyl-phosphate synthase large subunit|nr:ATP-grasp domain-containing protein [Rickettsiales bacterium]